MSKGKSKVKVIRLNGHLHEVVKSYDKRGKLVHTKVKPLHVEFHLRDAMQVIIGASILAVPVGFTEETWKLGGHLPWANIIGLFMLSIAFISFFTYYDSYRKHLNHFWNDYIMRIAATYLFVLIVVGTILTLIDVMPWATNAVVAIKRLVIVAFPASMSAAITDTIK